MSTLDFIIKNLNKAKHNLEKQQQRQGVTPSEIANLEEKVKHWDKLYRVWTECNDVKGEWICLEQEIGLYECSLCNHRILRAKSNYCPNCGAEMKE